MSERNYKLDPTIPDHYKVIQMLDRTAMAIHEYCNPYTIEVFEKNIMKALDEFEERVIRRVKELLFKSEQPN